MAPEIKNVSAERAAADLAAKLERRSVGPSGTRPDDYEAATSELERLEEEEKIERDLTK